LARRPFDPVLSATWFYGIVGTEAIWVRAVD
jgi:hypothetical protein